MSNNNEVIYGVPGRQLGMILAHCVVLPIGIMAGAVIFKSGIITVLVAVTGLIGMIVAIVRHSGAVGTARLEADALHLTPIRKALCAPSGPVSIRWEDIHTLNAEHAQATPRPNIQIKTNGKIRSLVISARRIESGGMVKEIADAARKWQAEHPGARPMKDEEWFTGPAWKAVSIATIVLLVLGVFGIIYTGRSGDWGLWFRLFAIAGMMSPIMSKALKSKR